MALSITSSEKTPKNPTFSKEINTCCPASAPHRSEGFFSRANTTLALKRWRKTTNLDHCIKWSLIYIYIQKNTTMGATYQTKNKKIHGWFVCCSSLVGSLIPSSRGQELHCRIHGISLATTLPRHGAIDGQRLGLRTAIAWGLANGRAPCFNWFMMELVKLYSFTKKRGAISTKIR